MSVLLLTGCGVGQDIQPQRNGSEGADASLLDGVDSSGESDVLQAVISTNADAILNGINLRRAQQGVVPLVIEQALVDMAYERASDMAFRGYLDHEDPVDQSLLAQSALSERGFYGQAGELVFGSDGPLPEMAQITLESWFDDADHRTVLLNPDFHFAGLGMMGDGTRWIVVILLAEGRP